MRISIAVSLAVAEAIIAAQIPNERMPNQIGRDQSSSQVAKAGKVEGRVTDEVTRAGVKKVTVTLRRLTRQGFEYSTTSTADGHFLFEEIPPGLYELAAERDGFIRQVYGARQRSSRGEPLNVESERHLKGVIISIIPLGVATGRVLDEDGDPITGVSVYAMQRSYVQGKRQLSTLQTTNTNDLGEYRVSGMVPGRYYMMATHSPRQSIRFTSELVPKDRLEQGYAPMFYPGVREVVAATPVEIQPGAESPGIDFRLQKTRVFRVRGKVIDATAEQPLRNSPVYLQPLSPGLAETRPYMAPLDSQGSFEITGVLPGTYMLTARHITGEQRSFGCQPVEVSDTNVGGLTLTLSPGITMAGVMKMDVPSQSGQLRNIRVSLQPAESGMGIVSAMTNADGTFALRGVGVERHRVSLFGLPPGTYVKSIRFGDHDLAEGQLDLKHGWAGTWEITLGSDGGRVEGSVETTDAKAGVRILVTLIPDARLEGRVDLLKIAYTDPRGNFRIRDVAPGDYKIFAWEDTEPTEIGGPEIRKAFEKLAPSVSIRPSENETVQLKPIPADALEVEKAKLK